MKKIVLIAASFLLNTACVKYDCFAMNNHLDMASEHSSSSGQNGNRQHTVNNAEEEQRKMFANIFNFLESEPEAILEAMPKVYPEIYDEFIAESIATSVITQIKDNGFRDYQETLFGYTVAICASLAYKSAYEKTKKELEDIKNENQRQKERIED